MKRIQTPRVVIYKQTSPFKNGKGKIETKYVGEIRTNEGAPRKVYGAKPDQLGKLLRSNISSMGITTYDLSSDPKDRSTKLRDSIPPEAEVKQLEKEEAGAVHTALKSE